MTTLTEQLEELGKRQQYTTAMDNRPTRGPKWAQIPFYNLAHSWWPDREAMRLEAESVRDDDTKYKIETKVDWEMEEGKTLNLKSQFSNPSRTPILCEFHKAFTARYGDLGNVKSHYFYIGKDSDYEWHRDDMPAGRAIEDLKSVNCCINIICTDTSNEVEFMEHGSFAYTAGVLNTSHVHRVKPTDNRILARLTFTSSVYEEVVHRIRKVDKKNPMI